MTDIGPKNRTSPYAFVVAVLAAVAALAIYFYRFHGALSADSKDWADFGTYLGGILGPIYAFLAFAVAMKTLQQMRSQSRRDEILKAIHSCEAEYERCASMPVTCTAPWIWGNDLGDAYEIKEVSLRTLLTSDGIDWEGHLPPLASGLKFRKLTDGELVQDRDVFLRAYLSLKGLNNYVLLYQAAEGDQLLVQYLLSKYEIASNRIQTAMAMAGDQIGT